VAAIEIAQTSFADRPRSQRAILLGGASVMVLSLAMAAAPIRQAVAGP